MGSFEVLSHGKLRAVARPGRFASSEAWDEFVACFAEENRLSWMLGCSGARVLQVMLLWNWSFKQPAIRKAKVDVWEKTGKLPPVGAAGNPGGRTRAVSCRTVVDFYWRLARKARLR